MDGKEPLPTTVAKHADIHIERDSDNDWFNVRFPEVFQPLLISLTSSPHHSVCRLKLGVGVSLLFARCIAWLL